MAVGDDGDLDEIAGSGGGRVVPHLDGDLDGAALGINQRAHEVDAAVQPIAGRSQPRGPADRCLILRNSRAGMNPGQQAVHVGNVEKRWCRWTRFGRHRRARGPPACKRRHDGTCRRARARPVRGRLRRLRCRSGRCPKSSAAMRPWSNIFWARSKRLRLFSTIDLSQGEPVAVFVVLESWSRTSCPGLHPIALFGPPPGRPPSSGPPGAPPHAVMTSIDIARASARIE